MQQTQNLALSKNDREVLRRLAERLAAVAAKPEMSERLELAKKINRLEGERPLVLLWPGGNLLDKALPESDLLCEVPWARRHEREIRLKLYSHEVIGDDTIFLPRFEHRGFCIETNFGVETVRHWTEEGYGHGSMVWDAPLKDLPKDFSKLRFREHTFDKETHRLEGELLREAFGDILPVEDRGIWFQWTMGFTNHAVYLIGLERFLYGMYDEPENIHQLMAFLCDDHMRMLDYFEEEGLLRPNDGDGIMAAGGFFHTDQLPQPDYVWGTPARLKDMWALSESQETVGVSPEMFAEFVHPYHLPVIERFGLSCYGCCEPLDSRWHVITQISNLRRVSVSPWANEEKMTEYLGKDYIYSRKPNPSLISSEWNEDAIRQDLRYTLELTKGMSVEFIMKDVMTVQGEPWRYHRWVEIAHEEIDRIYGLGS